MLFVFFDVFVDGVYCCKKRRSVHMLVDDVGDEVYIGQLEGQTPGSQIDCEHGLEFFSSEHTTS